MTLKMTKNNATGRQIAKGAVWLMSFKLLDKSIGLISTLILVRILTPSDFGLVAMAMAVVSLLELMGAFGFDTALIQRRDTERSHFDTAWTFNVIFGASIAVILLLAAVPASEFYREPRLVTMLPALAIGSLATGFENIGTVAFRKELDFALEFRYLLSKRIASFAVSVTLALTLRSFWSLIFGIVISKILSVIISYRIHPYRPKFSLSAKDDLFNFSKWLFISNLIQFLHSRSTDFILGRTVGSYALGVYNLAAEVAAMPSTELIAPLNRAVYPAYAQLANNQEKLMERFLEVFGLINLIAFPVALGLFSLSDLLVNILLGTQWKDAIPIMRILGLSGLVGALQGNMYSLMSAMGKPKANTLLSSALLILSLPLVIYASVNYGALGAAYAHLLSSFIAFIGIIFVFKNVTDIKYYKLWAAMWRPLFSSSLMSASIIPLRSFFENGYSSTPKVLELILAILFGAFAYCAFIVSFWLLSNKPQGTEKNLLLLIFNKLSCKN